MTEQQWLASTDPQWLSSTDPAAMLRWMTAHPGGKGTVRWGGPFSIPSDRKLRLFACACALQIGAESLEAYGDEGERLVDPLAVAAAWCQAPHIPEQRAAVLREIFGNPFRPLPAYRSDDEEHSAAWLFNANVLAIAQGIYEGEECKRCRGHGYEVYYSATGGHGHCSDCGGAGRISIWNNQAAWDALHDSLVDAGCTSEHVLRHCRGEEPFPDLVRGMDDPYWRSLRGPHCKGCWLIDILLGKE